MMVLHFFLPVKIILKSPFLFIGLFLILLGVLVVIWAGIVFLHRYPPGMSVEDPIGLKTSGPYRFTRNPMYLGMLLIALGGSAGFGCVPVFLGPLIFWAVINYISIPLEEKKLEDAFGPQYREYKNSVRRWL
jgi:protein-S-isoprenylcysteine O-methyltransferase Ste14